MEDTKDNPGIYVPPPMIYALTFVAAVFVHRKIPINDSLFHWQVTKMAGIFFLLLAIFFLIRSLRQFFKSKNTVVTIKPASSLQKDGIYSVTRNPMYLGLAMVYMGISCLIGHWWNIILFPALIVVVQEYIIKREEKYLERRFGQEYLDYKSKVRRWL